MGKKPKFEFIYLKIINGSNESPACDPRHDPLRADKQVVNKSNRL
jgi:hypothetical protein